MIPSFKKLFKCQVLDIEMQKRGQVTLFIIIAIVIVAVVILAFILAPKLLPQMRFAGKAIDPETYVQDCINNVLEPDVELLASQGGYLKQLELYIIYKQVHVGYLCYTNLDNQPCFNQQPFLKDSVEKQLTDDLRSGNIVTSCINEFRDAAQKQGYDVSVCPSPKFSVNLTESKVNVPITCQITMTKGQETKTVEKLNPFLKWPLYEFVLVSREIVDEEISYGNFGQQAYMMAHPWISIDRFKAESTTIYTLKEISSSKIFMFAVRNFVKSGGI